MYFIGGSASWGNIRGVLGHNIPDIRIYEEGAFKGARVDGWGISDRQLFEEADAVFQRESKPFFAVVHTAGNHRPWTIPAERGDFVLRDVDKATLNANGFDSLEEFNSWRFLDHSIGHFMDLARAADWGRDTLFLVLGDHGAGAPGDTAWERLGLTHVHTPLIVHGPAFTGPARTIDTVMSSVDVLPTALSLAGIRAQNPTLGCDVFDDRDPRDRFAFVRIPAHHGLVGQDLFLSMHRKRPDARLYAYRSADPTRDVRERFPEEAARMERLCRAYLETSRWMLHGRRAAPRGDAAPLPAAGLEAL